DGALPDQLVQLEVIAAEHALQFGRGAEGVAGRTDRLVSLLRVLALAGVDARLLGNVLGAIQGARLGSRRLYRLLRQVQRVGSHIGDVAVLVQALRDAHGLASGKTQLSRGFLL